MILKQSIEMKCDTIDHFYVVVIVDFPLFLEGKKIKRVFRFEMVNCLFCSIMVREEMDRVRVPELERDRRGKKKEKGWDEGRKREERGWGQRRRGRLREICLENSM